MVTCCITLCSWHFASCRFTCFYSCTRVVALSTWSKWGRTFWGGSAEAARMCYTTGECAIFDLRAVRSFPLTLSISDCSPSPRKFYRQNLWREILGGNSWHAESQSVIRVSNWLRLRNTLDSNHHRQCGYIRDIFISLQHVRNYSEKYSYDLDHTLTIAPKNKGNLCISKGLHTWFITRLT